MPAPCCGTWPPIPTTTCAGPSTSGWCSWPTTSSTRPSCGPRGEQLKHDLLTRAEVREWVATLWLDAKARLRAEAVDESSLLRTRLAAALVATGRRLQDDAAVRATVESTLEDAVRYAAEHFHGEIAELITGTISRWDSEETSRRLELLLGPDLQYIRINGTVVGAAAGVALHAVAQLIS